MHAAAPIRDDRYGKDVQRVLFVTLLLNLTVVIGKLVAGLLSGSLAVLSDALHSSADALNNIVGIFIIRMASAAPDEDHHFGHHKFETIAAFGIAWFLLVMAFQLGRGAIYQLLGWSEGEVVVTPFTVTVMILSMVINSIVWFYERRRAKELKSSFLLADSKHTLSDIYITSSILAGLLLIRFGIINLDSILALVVAAIITHAAYQIFASTIPVLVDRTPFPREYLEEIVRATPGVISVHDVMSRGVPGKTFVTMHLIAAPPDTHGAHEVTEAVERRLADKIGPCQVIIHIEPDEDSSSNSPTRSLPHGPG
jgi:cation diffusion facilitator family transporter